MESQAKEIVIFKESEFLLMLAAAGVNNWYGIDLSKTALDSDNEKFFNLNLASLYMKQIVEWNEDKASISESYRPIFKVLRDAKVCILCKLSSMPGNIKGCYCSEGNVVTIERSTAVADEIEVSMQTAEEWIDELTDSGIFPESAGEPDDEDVPDTGSDYVCEFELQDIPGGRLIEAMSISEYGLYAIMKIKSGKAEKREFYSPDKTAEILRVWSGGSE